MTSNPLVPVPRYVPMIATQVSRPFHCDGWIYEERVDGWRMLAYRDGKTVRLESRNGVDHSQRFQDLAAAIHAGDGGAGAGQESTSRIRRPPHRPTATAIAYAASSSRTVSDATSTGGPGHDSEPAREVQPGR
jgi:hypothetical protein